LCASGRKNPRTGGIIRRREKKKEEGKEIIAHDPFYQNEIAQYEIIEFEASKYCPELKTVLNNPVDKIR